MNIDKEVVFSSEMFISGGSLVIAVKKRVVEELTGKPFNEGKKELIGKTLLVNAALISSSSRKIERSQTEPKVSQKPFAPKANKQDYTEEQREALDDWDISPSSGNKQRLIDVFGSEDEVKEILTPRGSSVGVKVKNTEAKPTFGTKVKEASKELEELTLAELKEKIKNTNDSTLHSVLIEQVKRKFGEKDAVECSYL